MNTCVLIVLHVSLFRNKPSIKDSDIPITRGDRATLISQEEVLFEQSLLKYSLKFENNSKVEERGCLHC